MLGLRSRKQAATIRSRMDVTAEDMARVQAELGAGYARGIERYGDLGLQVEVFFRDVIRAIRASRELLGLPTTELQLRAALAKRAIEDLYLARACEHGHERAWDVLVAEFEPRLRERAGSRIGPLADGERDATALLADLALPPPKGNARTRIGTFQGLGALWPWLLIQFQRRHWRTRWKQVRESASTDMLHAHSNEAGGWPPPVWSRVLSDEAGDELERIVTRVWKALGARERNCFVLKHRMSMRQRRIAELLGLPEYTVSRAIRTVVDSMREAVERSPVLADASNAEPLTWERLAARLGSVIERVGVAFPIEEGGPHG